MFAVSLRSGRFASSPVPMPFPPSRTLRWMPAAAAALALAACADAPTASTSYAQTVGGTEWVAVAEPAGLPRADTWLPFAAPDSPARAEVHALRSRAGRARSAGHPEEALALEADALQIASAAVVRITRPQGILEPMSALDAWIDRARARLETAPNAPLEAAAEQVEAQSAAAHAALAAGDTLTAVDHVTRGTLTARQHSPMAVGLRLLASAEARLSSGAAGGSAAARARSLLVGAREGLAMGDSIRALRRAVYALQLLENAEARRAPVDPEPAPR